jgi:hypothetical protein
MKAVFTSNPSTGKTLKRKSVRELKKEVEGNDKPFTTDQRIEIRRELNQRLNIYK